MVSRRARGHDGAVGFQRARTGAAAARGEAATASAATAPGKLTLTMQLARAAPVQRRAADEPGAPGARDDVDRVHDAAARGAATPGAALPHAAVLQRLFGRHDLSGIRAHTGAEATAAAREIGAAAYTRGEHVVLGARADLHTVAHEVAHVIQQRTGVDLRDGVGEAGDPYERLADEVADRVVRGESVEALLGEPSAPAAEAAVQRVEYDKAKVGAYYEVEDYEFPLYLRTKWRETTEEPERGAFRMSHKPGPEVELPLARATKQADPPKEDASGDEHAARTVLGAIWDAFARIQRVVAALKPVVEDTGQGSEKVREAKAREGKDFLVAFHDNLAKVLQALRPQLQRSDLLFTNPQPNNRGTIHETARTNLETGDITLYAAFFDSDRGARGNTITHEMIHQVLKVEDQAYRTTRLFSYLKPEYRLKNPDSYVQLLNELDPLSGDVTPPPGFEVAEDVVLDDAPTLKRDVAIVQHVAQRANYYLTACAQELRDGLPVFSQQSPHLRAYLKVIQSQPKCESAMNNANTLHDWASGVAARCGLVAVAMSRNVEVVATTPNLKEGKIVDKGGTWLVTFHSETKDPRAWFFVKLLTALNGDGAAFAWNVAAALITSVEPFSDKIV